MGRIDTSPSHFTPPEQQRPHSIINIASITYKPPRNPPISYIIFAEDPSIPSSSSLFMASSAPTTAPSPGGESATPTVAHHPIYGSCLCQNIRYQIRFPTPGSWPPKVNEPPLNIQCTSLMLDCSATRAIVLSAVTKPALSFFTCSRYLSKTSPFLTLGLHCGNTLHRRGFAVVSAGPVAARCFGPRM